MWRDFYLLKTVYTHIIDAIVKITKFRRPNVDILKLIL